MTAGSAVNVMRAGNAAQKEPGSSCVRLRRRHRCRRPRIVHVDDTLHKQREPSACLPRCAGAFTAALATRRCGRPAAARGPRPCKSPCLCVTPRVSTLLKRGTRGNAPRAASRRCASCTCTGLSGPASPRSAITRRPSSTSSPQKCLPRPPRTMSVGSVGGGPPVAASASFLIALRLRNERRNDS
jgi:hypothetical protein